MLFVAWIMRRCCRSSAVIRAGDELARDQMRVRRTGRQDRQAGLPVRSASGLRVVCNVREVIDTRCPATTRLTVQDLPGGCESLSLFDDHSQSKAAVPSPSCFAQYPHPAPGQQAGGRPVE